MPRRCPHAGTVAVRLLVLGCAVASSAGFARAPVRPMQIADAVGLRSTAALYPIASFSPQGRLLAYTVCDPRQIQRRKDGTARIDATRATAGCSIHVRPYDERSSHRDGRDVAVSHEGATWAPSWSPDGERLAFYGEDPDGIHLWIWDRETQRSRRVSDEAVDVTVGGEIPLWSADGERLFTKLRAQPQAPSPAETATSGETVAAHRPPWAAPGAEGATVGISVSGMGSQAKPEYAPVYLPVDVASIEADTGSVARLATDVRVAAYWLSPDRGWLAFTRDPRILAQDRWSYRWSLEVVDLTSGQRRTLAALEQAHGASVRWAPDSRSLAYFSGPGPDSLASAFVVGIDGAEPRRLSGAADFGTFTWHLPAWDRVSRSVYAIDEQTLWRGDVETGRLTAIATWHDRELLHIVVAGEASGEAWSSDDGETLHIATRDRRTKRGEIIRVSVATGATHVLRDESLSIGERYGLPVVAPSGRVLAYAAQNGQQPAELWIASADLRRRQRLTVLNPALEAYPLGAQRLIEFRSRDGTPLEATLLLPAGHTPGRRYPLVVWVYGGKMGSDNAWRFGLTGTHAFNMQMLATRGYAVLFPDIPLTSGAHIKSLTDAVMPAIDKAIDLGIADAQRLAVMGQSSGGYATLSLVTRTNRFKAGIICAGFAELASFYGHGWTQWAETGDGGIGAAPWEAPQRYVENSPVYALDRIQTALLIQAGDQDPAVGEFPRHIYTSLDRLKKNATYLRYRGEGHVLQSHANLVDFWDRVAAFLEWHLQDR